MTSISRARTGRRGGALVTVSIAVMAMAALSFSLRAISSSSASEQRGAEEILSSRYVCEAAISAAVLDLSMGGTGTFGSQGAPVQYGDATYRVATQALPNDVYQVSATGVGERAGTRIELTLVETTDVLRGWAAFGEEGVTIDDDVIVDSYDSTLGTYAAQAVNGAGSSAYAGSAGDVGSNQNIGVKDNALVHGDATPGPGSSTTIIPPADVTGSKFAMPTAIVLPSVSAPIVASSGPLTVPSAAPLTLPSGSHRFEDFVISSGGSVVVEGPAELVLASCLLEVGAELIIDATNGPVELWVEGDFVLDSDTLIASQAQLPEDVSITLLADNVKDPSIDLHLSNASTSSNVQVFASMFAPNARLDVDGNFELFGAMVARFIDLDHSARIHHDVALKNAGTGGPLEFEPVCWRVLPFKP